MANANNNIEAKLAEGKKLLKQGKSLAKGGFFTSRKPDEAELVLEDARKKFKSIRPPTAEVIDLLLETLELLSQVNYDLNNFLQAATMMEEGARSVLELNKDHPENIAKAKRFYEQASVYWRMNKQYEKAADSLKKLAELTADKDVAEGISYYWKSIEIEEEEKRFHMVDSYFDPAIKLCISNERYADAIKFLERQIIQYENQMDTYLKRIWRNVTSIVIIQLYLKNVQAANETFNNYTIKYQSNAMAPEGQLGLNLLNAFMKVDEEYLQKLQKSGDVGIYLTTPISRLAIKLNLQDIKQSALLEQQTKKENDAIKETVKQDVDDEALNSASNNVELDETGAPIL